MPPLAAGVEFLDVPLAVFGGLLVAGALISGLARRSFLSLTAAFVGVGFLLGEGGLEVLNLDPTSQFVQGLAVVALIVILFRDGLEVEEELLQEAWQDEQLMLSPCAKPSRSPSVCFGPMPFDGSPSARPMA